MSPSSVPARAPGACVIPELRSPSLVCTVSKARRLGGTKLPKCKWETSGSLRGPRWQTCGLNYDIRDGFRITLLYVRTPIGSWIQETKPRRLWKLLAISEHSLMLDDGEKLEFPLLGAVTARGPGDGVLPCQGCRLKCLALNCMVSVIYFKTLPCQRTLC